MVKASKGYRRRTRYVMQKRARTRGLSPITKILQTFAVGDKVNINIDPSMHKGQPHVRFHGHTGTVVGTQGRSYMLDVRMGDMMKQVIVGPEHLTKSK